MAGLKCECIWGTFFEETVSEKKNLTIKQKKVAFALTPFFHQNSGIPQTGGL